MAVSNDFKVDSTLSWKCLRWNAALRMSLSLLLRDKGQMIAIRDCATVKCKWTVRITNLPERQMRVHVCAHVCEYVYVCALICVHVCRS